MLKIPLITKFGNDIAIILSTVDIKAFEDVGVVDLAEGIDLPL